MLLFKTVSPSTEPFNPLTLRSDRHVNSPHNFNEMHERRILAYKKSKLCLISILYTMNTKEECFIRISVITKSMVAL